MSQEKERTAKDILRDLQEFIAGDELDVASMPIERVQEELTSHGLSATSEGFHEVQGLLKKAVAEERIAKAQLRTSNFAQRVEQYRRGLGETVSRTRTELIRQIEALAGTGQQEKALVYLSKLEHAPDEDLSTLVEDLDLLKSLSGDDLEDS